MVSTNSNKTLRAVTTLVAVPPFCKTVLLTGSLVAHLDAACYPAVTAREGDDMAVRINTCLRRPKRALPDRAETTVRYCCPEAVVGAQVGGSDDTVIYLLCRYVLDCRWHANASDPGYLVEWIDA